MVKKLAVLMLAAALVFSFCGCAAKPAAKTNTSAAAPSSAIAATTQSVSASSNISDSDKQVLAAVNGFLDALKNSDYNKFVSIADSNGIALIGTITSTSERNFYAISDIPKNLSLPVSGKPDFVLKDHFQASIKSKFGADNISQTKTAILNITDSPTNKAPSPSNNDIMNSISITIKRSALFDPVIYTYNDKEILLSEAELDNGYPFGALAYFKMDNGQYKLCALLLYA